VSTEIGLLDSRFVVEAAPHVTSALHGLGLTAPAGIDEPQHQLSVTERMVVLDGTPVGAIPAGTPALDAVLTVLNATALAETSCYAVHAGVVAREGRVAAFPAVSGAGKSTLTAACVLVGLDYVSDEALLVRDDLSIRAYLKPLTLSAWALERFGLRSPDVGQAERAVALAELTAAREAVSLQLTHVVRLERAASNGVSSMSRAEAARMLLERSFNHFRDPRRAFHVATSLAAASQAVTLSYDDPVRGAELLAELLTVAPTPERPISPAKA
jgi:hypothetical protein